MAADLASFPFPFKDGTYRYSNNAIPLEPPVCIELTHEYKDEIELKRYLLDRHPGRCFQSLPHSMRAQWEALDLLVHELSETYPQQFYLREQGNHWTFSNILTREKASFTYGDPESLPEEPLNFIGRHVQEDLIIMGQRDGELYLEAGQLCFPANWSLAFNLGMAFKDIHFPVPELSGSRLLEKIRRFIMRIEPARPWVRRNWSLTIDRQLDTSLETLSSWGKKKYEITPDNAGERVHLRVEVQKLFRLPGSHSILFSIHTHLLPVEKLILNEQWCNRFYSVLRELPEPIADYKGLVPFREPLMAYLSKKRSGSVSKSG
ncbi:MAG TPA: DUF3445 domain-containing protein [Bacillales bacterium]|nr:DUF3445 domain-containing protein [Bacillales bacterium]